MNKKQGTTDHLEGAPSPRQLRWLGHLYQIPPGILRCSGHVLSGKGPQKEPGPAGGAVFPNWPGNFQDPPERSGRSVRGEGYLGIHGGMGMVFDIVERRALSFLTSVVTTESSQPFTIDQ